MTKQFPANKVALLSLILFLFSLTSRAQRDGDLDSAFNANTALFTADFGGQDNLNDVKIQADGKIVATGVALTPAFTGELKVIRLNDDGTPDNNFGTNGIFTFSQTNEAYGIQSYIRTDGKIVVAGLASLVMGYYDFLVLRLNDNGTIDSTFGTNGYTVVSFANFDDLTQAMTVQDDGKIIVSGTITDSVNYFNNPAIIRFTEDGFLDSAFGTNGVLFIPGVDIDNELTGLKIQPDGKILASGHWQNVNMGFSDYDVMIVRAKQDGTLDSTFGINGIVRTSVNGGVDDCFGIDQDVNGNIFVAGFTTLPTTLTLDMILLKYDSTGTPDPTFGTNGLVTYNDTSYDVGNDVKCLPDGNIIVGGASGLDWLDPRPFTLWRYLPDGSLDTTFGVNGVSNIYFSQGPNEINSIALQSDYKVVAAGKIFGGVNNDVGIARFMNSSGNNSIHEATNASEVFIYPNPVTSRSIISGLTSGDRLELYDLSGRLIQSMKPASSSFTFEKGSLSSGTYILKIVSTSGTFKTGKLIIG